MTPLKPCPFNAAHRLEIQREIDGIDGDDFLHYTVAHTDVVDCFATGLHEFYDEASAIAAWNRRVAAPETVRLRYQREEAAALIRSLTVINIDPETRARAVAWLSAYAEEAQP